MNQLAKKVIGILLFVFLISSTAYSQNLELDLHRAVMQNDIATVKTLLAQGADVNAKDKYGFTALMSAVAGEYIDIVEILLAQGADVNARHKKDGSTALIGAVSLMHTDVVEILLAQGADVNAKNRGGVTALMYAALKGHPEIVKILLSEGADVNMKNNEGTTALMTAAVRGHEKIVEILLSKGANVNVKDKEGWTALMHVVDIGTYTEDRKYVRIANLLKQAEMRNSSKRVSQFNYDNVRREAERHKRDTLVFKGFYLGMDIQNACGLINHYFNSDFSIEKLDQPKEGLFYVIRKAYTANDWGTGMARALYGGMLTEIGVIDEKYDLLIAADKNRKVNVFHFSSKYTDALFNSVDMDVESFAKSFANAYGIPSLEVYQETKKTLKVFYQDAIPMDEVIYGYEYTSPKGWKAKVSFDKDVTVKTVPKRKERGFD